jgi:hypothetical protein
MAGIPNFRRNAPTRWQVSWLAAVCPWAPDCLPIPLKDSDNPNRFVLLTVAETASAFHGIPFYLMHSTIKSQGQVQPVASAVKKNDSSPARSGLLTAIGFCLKQQYLD